MNYACIKRAFAGNLSFQYKSSFAKARNGKKGSFCDIMWDFRNFQK